MHQMLRFVKNSLREYWNFLHILLLFWLGEMHLGLRVPVEEQDLQDVDKMELVRAENFQLSEAPHHRRPQWR